LPQLYEPDYNLFLEKSPDSDYLVLEKSPESVVLIANGKCVYANQSAAKLHGFDKPEDLIGQDMLDFVSPSDMEGLRSIIEGRAKGEKQPLRYEFKLRRIDGSEIDAETHVTLINFEGRPASLTFTRDITERKRLENLMRRKLEALYRHATELGRAETLNEVVSATLKAVEQILGFDRGGFGIVEGGEIHFTNIGDTSELLEMPLNGPGITVRAVKTGETQLVPDTRLDESFVPGLGESRVSMSELDVPVKIQGKTVALINIESSDLNAFTDEDRRLTEIFAEHVSSTIRGLERAEQRRYEEQLEALHRHVYKLELANNIDDVTAATFRALQQTLGFDRGSLGFVEDDFIYFKNFGGQSIARLPLNGPGITVRTVRTGKTQLVHDVRKDKDFLSGQSDETKTSLSELDVPVKIKGKTVAIINIESMATNAFTEEDRKLVEIFAEHVASAMLKIRNEAERRRYQERLESLHQHANELSRAGTIREVAEQTFNTIEGVLGFNEGGFGVVEGNILRFIHMRGVETDEAFELPLEGPGITVRVVNTGETQLVADTREDESFVPLPLSLYKCLSELAVPVKVGGSVVAVINVESESLDAFTGEDQRLVEIFAEHIASAIRRLREQEEQRKYDERLEALHRHVTELGMTKTLQEVAERTFDTIERVLGFNIGGFAIVDGSKLRFIHNRGIETKDFELPLDGSGITVRAVKTGKTQLVSDARKDEDYIHGAFEGVIDTLSELTVPVRVGGSVTAVINVESEQLNAFTEEDRKLLEIFAEHIASTIRRLEEQTEQRRYEERLETLHRHATELSKAETVDEIAEETLDCVERVIGFNVGSFAVVEGDRLRHINIRGVESAGVYEMPLNGPGITVRAVRTGETQLVPDCREDGDFEQGLERILESLSELVVPVKIEDKVVAVINVESERLNSFTFEDKKLLEIFAMHVSTVMIGICSQEKMKRNIKELELSNKDLDDYTYAVSHDLKAPIRTIKAFSSFLEEDYGAILDETGKDCLRRVASAATNMDRLIEELLLLSRVGRKFTNLEVVNLNELLEEIKSDQVAILNDKKASLIVENLPKITIQRIWLKQLISNLINNGLKFNKSLNPTVQVSYTVDDESYTFSVKDNGIGIDEKYYSQIFKLFERLHSSEEYEGTGAGLSISKKIAEYFGGKIWVESKPGVGSTFYFTIPKEGRQLRE